MDSPGWEVEGWEGGDDLLGFEGDRDDLADEAEDLAFVAFAVGVVGEARAGVGGDVGPYSRAERLPRR